MGSKGAGGQDQAPGGAWPLRGVWLHTRGGVIDGLHVGVKINNQDCLYFRWSAHVLMPLRAGCLTPTLGCSALCPTF